MKMVTCSKSCLFGDHREMPSLLKLTLSQTINFRLFRIEEFADDNFKFNENGGKFFKPVESTCYEQFLLFPQCFQKTCNADT